MSHEDAYQGPISVTRTGKGFFTYDENKDDLFIPEDALGGAFPGDIVKVVPTGSYTDPKTRTKREGGKVVEVVTRTRETFVGLLAKNDRQEVILIPDWKKMYTPFLVKGEALPIGHKVVLRFRGWEKNQPYPWGVVEEVIGPAGVHETEMRAIALSQGFHSDFPPGVVKEAAELEHTGEGMINAEAARSLPWDWKNRTATNRRDFRQITTFTIDPVDAKDFDDAISVRSLDDGDTEVGIHIADVSFFVRPGTSIDNEARNRATSVYLVDRTIPMLPHVLSTNFCSLNPDLDRLAMSAVFILDKDANIKDKWFGETLIHSDKRFTYEEAQGVLNAGEGTLIEELKTVLALSKKIRARRVANGAIEFDTAEVKVEIDENGKPIAVRLKERQDTNLLIEDFMLLANEAVAEHLDELGKKEGRTGGLMFRVHDSPDADRIENLTQFLKVMGYDLKSNAGVVKGKDLNALLDQLKGKPEEYLIKTATLRSMAKAMYKTKNAGHFGLAFEYYTHFTSPIRRYPDLLVHRLVKHFAGVSPMPKSEREKLDELAIHSSEREVSAAEAERDSVKLKLVEFMSDKIGTEFDAVISGVSDRGIYVELNETHAEGMVRIRDLGQDYYVHDEKRYRVVGERTKEQFSLGDPIRVKLTAARLFEKELDFQIVKKR